MVLDIGFGTKLIPNSCPVAHNGTGAEFEMSVCSPLVQISIPFFFERYNGLLQTAQTFRCMNCSAGKSFNEISLSIAIYRTGVGGEPLSERSMAADDHM
jgi:hypothetical protein